MTNPLLAGLAPTHPGEVLREDILPAIGKPKAEIARLLRISRQHLHDILSEKKPVTTNVALRLSRMLGTTPELWGRMQMAYDFRIEERALRDELATIPLLDAA